MSASVSARGANVSLRKRVQVVVILLVSTIAARASELPYPMADDAPAAVDEYLSAAADFLAGGDIGVLRRTAALVGEQTRLTYSPHDAALWVAATTLTFDGLELDVIEVANGDRAGVTGARISTAGWVLRHGLAVGVSTDRLLATLGAPDYRDPTRWSYFGDTSGIDFELVDGRIVAITIDYHWC